MLRRAAAVAFAAILASPATAQTASKDPAQAPAGAYRLETSHSQLLFAIPHLGLTDFYGRFDKLSGTLNFDPNQPEKSAVSITVDTTSIDTPSGALNNELKGASVFDAANFPTASFKSTSIARTGADTGTITGDLTIKGVTKPVTLDVVFHGGEQNPMNDSYALGFRGTATIKRTDFGLSGMIWEPMVGNDVTLIVEAMFQQQKR
ncbi:MAG TPA: YceI family protein [Rhizomicrobium sp.]|nr:YceI family protein [Rhizomicrobium sp.]